MNRAVQRFEVSLKAFIVADGRALFVREADTGYWELPGGRIDVGEEWLDHADVLAREIREELGEALVLTYGPQAFSWTRQRPTDGVFLHIIARIGHVVSGVPVLSGEHDDFAWLRADEALGLSYPPRSGYRTAIPMLWRMISA